MGAAQAQGDRDIQEEQYVFPYHYLDLMAQYAYRNTTENSYRRLVAGMIAPYRGQTVLDAGCGDGRLAYELAKKNLAVTGIDYSERAIRFARAFAPRVRFLVTDLVREPPGEEFEVICLVEVLEHLDPESGSRLLQNLAKCLAPGGRLIITVPSTRVPLIPKHDRHFSVESLRKTIEPPLKIETLSGHLRVGIRYYSYRKMLLLDRLVLGMLRRKVPGMGLYYRMLERLLGSIEECPPEKAARLIVVCGKDENQSSLSPGRR